MKPAETYTTLLKNLADTMLGVARESVALLKRSDQEKALKLTRNQEWEVYLEFLRMLFNVVDRLSAFHIPLQDQPEFMNSLEDNVSTQLKTVLAPTLSSSEIDDMEVTIAVGKTVAESRQVYERFRFVITESSKQRDEYFQFFAERIAGKAGMAGSQNLVSAALLCGTAVVPAFQRLFEDALPQAAPAGAPEAAASSPATPQQASDGPAPPAGLQDPQSIKLVTVLSRVSGEEVETRWGVHPRFQRDLKPEEARELVQHMNRVTRILGERFAVIATLTQSSPSQPQAGHA